MHVSLMSLGIILDIGMVLYLQVTRHAIQTAIGPKPDLLQRAHILASSSALILYFPVIYFGLHLLFSQGQQEMRQKHKKLALWALAFRTIGFILMFSLIKHKS